MRQWLDIKVESRYGSYPTRFGVDRVYNLGWTIRDEEKQRKHIEEVAREGVAIPRFKQFPVIFPVTSHIMTTASQIDVQRHRTCGEVEFVLLRSPEADLVTVGSDHTDRELEKHWIPWSKQACANVVAPTVWPMAEVREHWDRLVLHADVEVDGAWHVYQRAALGEFVAPERLWTAVQERVRVGEEQGIALLSGTVVSESETLVYAPAWRLRLEDPLLNRLIEHVYHVHALQDDFVDAQENIY